MAANDREHSMCVIGSRRCLRRRRRPGLSAIKSSSESGAFLPVQLSAHDGNFKFRTRGRDRVWTMFAVLQKEMERVDLQFRLSMQFQEHAYYNWNDLKINKQQNRFQDWTLKHYICYSSIIKSLYQKGNGIDITFQSELINPTPDIT